MCGIAGIWRPSGSNHQDLLRQIAASIASLTHRGPDDSGVWTDERASLALGQRRLAILDLTPAGHQPMVSDNGRWVIVFNGEVYNFRTIRAQLEAQGFTFLGGSDTEVVLAAVAHWGLEKALAHFVGMFALAVWDVQDRRLWLARDRMGIKPLYYYHTPHLFLFASELKGLMAIPDFRREIDLGALSDLLQFQYIPSSKAIFQNTRKLLPGHLACIDETGLTVKPYWNLLELVRQGRENRLNLSDAEAEEQLEGLIRESVRLRMIADVPLGAFLSGGIDSSMIVAAMQAEATGPVKTFTIAFTDQEFDESRFARLIATHLGTDHTELSVTPEIAREVIPLLPKIFDEPYADSSAIPTFLVSQLARQQVTVSLSGDGGDELFGGYLRYVYGRRFWRFAEQMPRPLRFLGAHLLDRLSGPKVDYLFDCLRPYLPPRLRFSGFAERLRKATAVMGAVSEQDAHRQIVSHWLDPGEILMDGPSQEKNGLWVGGPTPLLDFTELMMLIDQQNYLPEDILTKVDRTSMAVSLEARVPLLDHRLVSWVWQLPLHFKVREGQGKWLLRQVLSKYIPLTLFNRPKKGFSIPIGRWLRGPLTGWADELLDFETLSREGIFKTPVVHKYWQEHKSGAQDRKDHLWPILMFQAWKRYWLA